MMQDQDRFSNDNYIMLSTGILRIAWIENKFLGQTYRREKYADLNSLTFDKLRKNMTEFNIVYNNLREQAGMANMLRVNSIDHYLNRIPYWIERNVRNWLTQQENIG